MGLNEDLYWYQIPLLLVDVLICTQAGGHVIQMHQQVVFGLILVRYTLTYLGGD